MGQGSGTVPNLAQIVYSTTGVGWQAWLNSRFNIELEHAAPKIAVMCGLQKAPVFIFQQNVTTASK